MGVARPRHADGPQHRRRPRASSPPRPRSTSTRPSQDYAVRLVLATRDPVPHGSTRSSGYLAYGASPRATLGLVHAGRALALLRGRAYVLPQDVYDVAYDVLATAWS